MARFSNSVRVLERRLARLEGKQANSDFPQVQLEFCINGTITSNDSLKRLINMFKAATQEMFESVPKPKVD